MQGGGEDTDERVKIPHTEKCEKSEVASVKEGHYVERMIAQSDDCGHFEAVEGRNERVFDGAREEGVGSEDQSQGSHENRD